MESNETTDPSDNPLAEIAELKAKNRKLEAEKQEQDSGDYELVTQAQAATKEAEGLAERATAALKVEKQTSNAKQQEIDSLAKKCADLEAQKTKDDETIKRGKDAVEERDKEIKDFTALMHNTLSELAEAQNKCHERTKQRDDHSLMIDGLHEMIEGHEAKIESLNAQVQQNSAASDALEIHRRDLKALFRDLPEDLSLPEYIKHIREQQTDTEDGAGGRSNRNVSGQSRRSLGDELDGSGFDDEDEDNEDGGSKRTSVDPDSAANSPEAEIARLMGEIEGLKTAATAAAQVHTEVVARLKGENEELATAVETAVAAQEDIATSAQADAAEIARLTRERDELKVAANTNRQSSTEIARLTSEADEMENLKAANAAHAIEVTKLRKNLQEVAESHAAAYDRYTADLASSKLAQTTAAQARAQEVKKKLLSMDQEKNNLRNIASDAIKELHKLQKANQTADAERNNLTLSNITSVSTDPVAPTRPTTQDVGTMTMPAQVIPDRNPDLVADHPLLSTMALILIVVIGVIASVLGYRERTFWLTANDLRHQHLIDITSGTGTPHWLETTRVYIEEYIGFDPTLPG